MNMDQDLREFVGLLNEMGVRWLLVGGHAVAFHGYPRFTGDTDFFVDPTVENGERLVGVFMGDIWIAFLEVRMVLSQVFYI